MTTATHHFELHLNAKTTFDVTDSAGVQILCREGSLWITLDGDPRDILLDAGASYTPSEHRRALIYALAPSSLSLAMAHQVMPARRSWRKRVSAGTQVSFALQPA
jgi:hypothetical protein